MPSLRLGLFKRIGLGLEVSQRLGDGKSGVYVRGVKRIPVGNAPQIGKHERVAMYAGGAPAKATPTRWQDLQLAQQSQPLLCGSSRHTPQRASHHRQAPRGAFLLPPLPLNAVTGCRGPCRHRTPAIQGASGLARGLLTRCNGQGRWPDGLTLCVLWGMTHHLLLLGPVKLRCSRTFQLYPRVCRALQTCPHLRNWQQNG